METIKGSKEVDDKTFYLVKFEGWAKPQWEPEENVSGCQGKIEEFYAEEERKEALKEARWKEYKEGGHFEVHRIIDVNFDKRVCKVYFLVRTHYNVILSRDAANF